MNRQVQLWCVRMLPAFICIYIAAFVGLSRFIPPLSPTLSPADLAGVFDAHRQTIRGGQLICMVAAILYLPWTAVMSVHMRRIEGPLPVLAWLQFGGALILVVFFIICSMLWTIAAYRPDQDPMILRTLNDSAWLIFVMVYPEYLVQLVAIALVGFMDKRPEPLLPRWACFATLWVAFTGVGGSFATFFKTGPFAWDGLIGFWIPVICFLLWLLFVIYPALIRAIKREDPNHDDSEWHRRIAAGV